MVQFTWYLALPGLRVCVQSSVACSLDFVAQLHMPQEGCS